MAATTCINADSLTSEKLEKKRELEEEEKEQKGGVKKLKTEEMAATTCNNTDSFALEKLEKKRELEEEEKEQVGDVKKLKTEDSVVKKDRDISQLPRKKKCALLLSYCGVGYAGMQINPGVRTIEERLINALHKANAITDDGKECLGKMSFQRCARTDKGVSAARQVMVPLKSLLPEINGFLPPEIRIFGMIKATKAFDCKQNCSARTYEYLCPTFAFAKDYQSTVGYRITPEKVAQINDVLSNYKGTKNYHNFTSGKKAEDPSANRYIISFKCGEPFEREGREFIVLAVKGQSFMLHQIRKMIGLTIAIVRGVAPLKTFELAWAKKKVDIPKAPALGLILDTVHFDAYNRKFGNDGFHESLDWNLIEDDVQKFKAEFIHKHIVDTEIKEHTMMRWLNTLPSHTYTGEGMEEIGARRVASDKAQSGTEETSKGEVANDNHEQCEATSNVKEAKLREVAEESTGNHDREILESGMKRQQDCSSGKKVDEDSKSANVEGNDVEDADSKTEKKVSCDDFPFYI